VVPAVGVVAPPPPPLPPVPSPVVPEEHPNPPAREIIAATPNDKADRCLISSPWTAVR